LFSTVGGVSKEAYLDLYISPVVTALKLLKSSPPIPNTQVDMTERVLLMLATTQSLSHIAWEKEEQD
jgi:hypothetical protein